ncbi:anti-sigma factor domain-containing protein [Petrachloros mirabilis]
MTHEELEEAVPLYATGALDRTERQALEAHLLSGCQSCHVALKEFQSVASLLPFGLSPMQAPRVLKAKIMAARNPDPIGIENGQHEPGKPSLEPGEWMNHLFPPVAPARSVSLPWAIGLATFLVVGVGGYLAWMYSSQISSDASKILQLEASLHEQSRRVASLHRELGVRDRTLAELRADLQKRLSETAELRDQLMTLEMDMETAQAHLASGRGERIRQDELATLMRQPHTKVVSLTGSDIAPQASAMLMYDGGTQKAWLYSANLPECPNGTTYQLWAIDQIPVSIGTFHMAAGQTTHLLVKRMPDFYRARKFAISLEPAGGRPQPTGSMYLVSR